MKKLLLSLACILMGFTGAAQAATVDDLAVLKHDYVLVCDELGARPGKGELFGADHFLAVTSGTTSTDKGSVDLSVVNEDDDNHVTQAIADKYGEEYGGKAHYNWLRLKNSQDVIAMKVIAGSKLIFFIQGNNKTGTSARIPKIAADAALSNALNAAPDADFPATDAGFRYEWTADADRTIYVGSYNGDMFVSFIIVEVPEAPGTPTIKVGEQTFENGLWFREVSCKANDFKTAGSAEAIPTIVTYTTDGSTPTAASPVYTEPIKCYQNMTVKFQAYQDWGTGADEGSICPNADNETNVSFSFDAPTIEANGTTFNITSPYANQNGSNFYQLNGGEAVQGDGAALSESATVTAFSKIINGEYAEFTTKSTTHDVYVLNPIKEKRTIAVIAGDVVLDEVATETSTTGPVYKVENGAISAHKADFFVKNLTLKALADESYQVPAGNERYIQMSNTNITFEVAEGDSVNVRVICSKNACKNIDAEDAEDGSAVTDRKCFVNVDGVNYCHMDAEGNEAADLKLFPDANVIEFGLSAGIHTFKKYSGTGLIFISSIEIEPVDMPKNGASLTVAEELKRGEEFLLPVNIEFGKQNYTAFQMDVELPQGVSFVQETDDETGEGDYVVSYNPERVQSDHVIATNLLDGTNTLRIAGFSGTNKTFKGSDGEFLNVKVKVADNAWGNYEIKVSNIAFSNTKGQDDVFADATASFAVKKHLLKYIVDEQDYQSDSLFYGATIQPLADPTKEGYTFSGWSEIPEIMPAEDVVVTGEFTINSYLLTYKVDGDTVKSDSIVYASALTLIDEPTKEGYTFSGWSELPQTMPAKDVVVTGDFTINSYLLTYKVDGDTVKSDSIVYASALTLIDEPTKEGYTFSGWSELPQTMPAKDVVVTGTFTINSYLLTYKVDGDTVKSDSIVYASALTLIDEPTKEGYTFSGWSELPETMPAQDVVVTGTFTINSYVVTFKADGKVIKSETLTYGTAITAPEDPTKEGYTFVGWNPEVDATVPAKDVTYEAVYQVNVYAVIYMVNGKEWARDSVAYGETIVLKQYTPAEGETFNSWTSDQEYTTMPAHDVVYTANITTGIWGMMANREFVDVYNLQGGVVARRMPMKDLKKRLSRGVYIIEGRKVAIK